MPKARRRSFPTGRASYSPYEAPDGRVITIGDRISFRISFRASFDDVEECWGTVLGFVRNPKLGEHQVHIWAAWDPHPPEISLPDNEGYLLIRQIVGHETPIKINC